jgi:hypothetical protein
METLRAAVTRAIFVGAALFAVSGVAWGQSCQSSLNVVPDRTVVLQPWDGSQESLVLTCSEAEELRGKIFREDLAFLNSQQSATAARVTSEINAGLTQLSQARQELANVRTDQQAQGLSATVKSLRWLAAKTKLLICAGVTADTAGAGLVVCAKPFFDFVKQSAGLFKELEQASEAQQRAVALQQMIQGMQAELATMQAASIAGSATSQRYAQAFDQLCTQVKNTCLR